jgi:hypothetical protein
MIHQEPMQTAPEETPVSTCCHHWVIEPANGPISRGVCQRCNESREFKNSVVDIEREFHYTSPSAKADQSGRPGEVEE